MTKASIRIFSVALSLFTAGANAEEWLFLQSMYGNVNGFIGVNVAKSATEIESDSLTSLTGSASQSNYWQGFIYRPWISTVEMSTNLQANYNHYDIDKNSAHSTINGLFTTAVSLYPGSTYPTKFSLNQQVRKSVGTDDDLVLNTNFLIENKFTPAGESYKTDAKYGFTYNDMSTGASSANNALDLTFADTLENSDYSVSAYYSHRDLAFAQASAIRENTTLRYNQSWLSEEFNSTNVSLDLSKDTDNEKGVNQIGEYQRNSDYIRGQATLTSYRRSQTIEHLNYFTNGYINKTARSSSTLSSSLASVSARVSSGANYDYSEQVRYSASVEGGYSANAGSADTSTAAHLTVDYQDEISLSDSMTYGWFANDTISAFFGSNSERSNTTTIGDNLTKAFHPFGVSLLVSLNQSLSHEISSREPLLEEQTPDNEGNAAVEVNIVNEFLLTNSINVNISSNDQGVNTNFSARYSDVRHLTANLTSFKQGYVSLQRNAIIGSSDNWGGHFTYDWNRTVDINGVESTISNAFGEVWYRNTEVWEVPNLRFMSLLSFPFNSLSIDADFAEEKLASWKNDLDYRLGFLTLGLHTANTEKSYFISFDIKRNF